MTVTAKTSSRQAVHGGGRIDNLLAELRHHLAHRKLRLITPRHRCLDIGCGNTPLFLMSLDFQEKYGIEKNISIDGRNAAKAHQIQILEHDLGQMKSLPFEDNFFDAVTMLAVIEHLFPDRVISLLAEIHRVLRPGGILVATTPAAWTDMLLKSLAALYIISREEINDHKTLFTRNKLRNHLAEAGFDAGHIDIGTFECTMNLWATARKC